MERTNVERAATNLLPRYSPSPTSPAPALPTAPLGVVNPVMVLVGSDELTTSYLPALRRNFRVTSASTVATAIAAIERDRPAFVVTESRLPDGAAAAVCAAAKRFEPPATVMVITDAPEGIAETLIAGCDAVLLKPFAPNLLYARIGRLVRDRGRDLRMRAHVRRSDGSFAPERCGGTNRFWPEEQCPHCRQSGVTSFEFASHRRAWFACTGCRQAWIGRRLEEF